MDPGPLPYMCVYVCMCVCVYVCACGIRVKKVEECKVGYTVCRCVYVLMPLCANMCEQQCSDFTHRCTQTPQPYRPHPHNLLPCVWCVIVLGSLEVQCVFLHSYTLRHIQVIANPQLHPHPSTHPPTHPPTQIPTHTSDCKPPNLPAPTHTYTYR
jgi:hypothetical protein